MSNHRAITQLVKAISGQSNVLTIPRIYITLAGSHRAALLLSQCVYWSDKGADGWFYKTYDDWKSELGIPRGGIDTALKELSRWITTDVRQVGGTPKKHYKVMFDLLVSDISDLLENSTSTITKTTKASIRATRSEEQQYDGYIQ